MATELGTQATAHAAGTKLDTDKLAGRMRVSSDSLVTTGTPLIGQVYKLCWIPYGATIFDGTLIHSATNASVTTTGGIIGCSTTAVDDDADLFWTATNTATAAESRSAPKNFRKLVAAGTTPGYKVTDPNGANLVVTVAGAGVNVGSRFQAYCMWVMD